MTDTPDQAPSPHRFSTFIAGLRVGVIALFVSVVALVVAVMPYASGGDFDGRVRAYLLRNPEILQEISLKLEQQAQQSQLAQARTHAEEMTKRIAADPTLLTIDARDPAFGPTDARVTVVEFFDFRCPGCKSTAPEILRLMQTHPDVRFVFKDWPILDRGTDDVSHYAARAAQAAHHQGKYLAVFQALMAEPGLTKTAVNRILVANGVAMSVAQAEMAGPGIAQRLAEIQMSAANLGLQGTPTFFVNGRASASIQPADIDRAIRAAKSG